MDARLAKRPCCRATMGAVIRSLRKSRRAGAGCRLGSYRKFDQPWRFGMATLMAFYERWTTFNRFGALACFCRRRPF
jgi:hypothetical protein